MLNLLAYIDPGSTAFIWQVIAGIVIAFGVVLGIWWTKISTFFKGIWTELFGKNKKNGQSEAQQNSAKSEIEDDVDKINQDASNDAQNVNNDKQDKNNDNK